MAYITHSGKHGLCGDRGAPASSGVGAKLERLARLLTKPLEGQRRSALDQEMARLLAQSGGRLTDSLEREAMRNVFASDWSLPQ